MIIIEVLKFSKEQEQQYAELIKFLDEAFLQCSFGETYDEIRNNVMNYSVGFLKLTNVPFSGTFLRLEAYAKAKYKELVTKRCQATSSNDVVNDIDFLFS